MAPGPLRWIKLGFWSGRELSSPQCLTLLFDGGGGENESNSFLEPIIIVISSYMRGGIV